MPDEKLKIIPAVALRGMTLFPKMTLHFDVGRKASLMALNKAAAKGDDIFFVTQKDINTEYPTAEDLYEVGVVGAVRQIIRIPDRSGSLRVVVEGKYRAKVKTFEQTKKYFSVTVSKLNDEKTVPENFEGKEKIFEEATLFSLKKYFNEYCEHIPNMTADIMGAVFESKKAGEAADIIASNILLPVEDKQELLSQLNVYLRAERLCSILMREIEILGIDEELQNKVQAQMDKNQREYYLREELKAITEELQEIDGDSGTGLLSSIKKAGLPDDIREKLIENFERLRKMPSGSAEYNVLSSYIEKCLEIPWQVYTKENNNIEKAKKTLEKEHYGLKEVKQRITEMLAAYMISPDIKGQIICLAGPPGVGKTSVAKSIAKASNRKYARIALGGIRDEAEIRGHRKTYIGAMPGRIISALIEAKSMNPLILLDEIDKLGGDFRGDPSSALLEALDGEQNFAFRDHYIEMPVDLSKVLFITTANDKNAIPDALRDRMEIIDIPSYTYEEKFRIAKKHLLPKQMREHAIKKQQLYVSDSALRLIIDGYTREAGVRTLERKISVLCRKEALRLADGNEEKLCVTDKNLEDFLGARKYRPNDVIHEDEVGLVNGLAWTSVGGELLQVEVAVLSGTGKIELTGSLGDVMKESVRTAISFVRSRCEDFNIESDFYKTKDIHIHFPEGAVPKDGPSAGVTVTTALVSALSGRKVSGELSMTGEVTLRGRVLAIGGLREKSMAAYREGMKTVVIPHANIPDLEEVDEAVKEKITFIPVKHVDEVLSLALIEEKPLKQKNSKKEINIPVNKFNDKSRGVRTGELQ